MATTTHGDIYVPCEECGHMNTLRQTSGKVRALTHEEQFMAYIQEIVNELGGALTSREIARQVANRVLDLFCDWDQAPPYRIQVYSAEVWHTLLPSSLHNLR